MTHSPILLVGAGLMSQAYAKVLADLSVPFHVLGRGAESAATFADVTGVTPTTGALADQLAAMDTVPDTAILGVNAMYLADVAKVLMDHGVKRLLLEKPAALDLAEMDDLVNAANAHDAAVSVGYNRRFMASALVAQQMIAQDGGVSSVKFDFSEPARRIAKLDKPVREHHTWFYGNSSHVVDLAFHLFGAPTALQARVTGRLDWHPSGAVFAGSGINATGGLISWHANWDGPGRWGLEVMTPERRIIMQPLEKLRVQTHDSFAEVDVVIDDAEDLAFKPGVKKQVERFLFGTGPDVLSTLGDHAARMVYYDVIRTGGTWGAA